MRTCIPVAAMHRATRILPAPPLPSRAGSPLPPRQQPLVRVHIQRIRARQPPEVTPALVGQHSKGARPRGIHVKPALRRGMGIDCVMLQLQLQLQRRVTGGAQCLEPKRPAREARRVWRPQR